MRDALNVNRALTEAEERLVRWMLENGSPEAASFLPQLHLAEVTPWRCLCGCASINFQMKGRPLPSPGVHVIADFVFGDANNLSGVFLFENDGLLSGLEVYGLSGDAPKTLPSTNQLRGLQMYDETVKDQPM